MSAAPEFDFEMHQGDDKHLLISVLDEAGDAKSLAGVLSIRWWFAKKVTTADALVEKSVGSGITIVGSSVDGVLQVDIDSEDTLSLKGNFYHELEVIDSAGDIATVLRGTMTVVRALIDNP